MAGLATAKEWGIEISDCEPVVKGEHQKRCLGEKAQVLMSSQNEKQRA